MPKQASGQRNSTMQSNLFNSNIAEITISYSSKVKSSERLQITKSNHADAAFREAFPSLEHKEYFYAMFLDRANRVLGVYQVSSGGLTGTVVDPKIVFQAALKANACSIILAHNHPSGQIHPSEADISLTRKMKQAGDIMELQVLDHLIIATEGYMSFADDGRM
jgi:DNA repair protein RadC